MPTSVPPLDLAKDYSLTKSTALDRTLKVSRVQPTWTAKLKPLEEFNIDLTTAAHVATSKAWAIELTERRL